VAFRTRTRAATTRSVPPQNLEAEESVLGAAMLSPARSPPAARSSARRRPRVLPRSHTNASGGQPLALADRGEPVDAITLTDELEERRARRRRRPRPPARARRARPRDSERRPLRPHRRRDSAAARPHPARRRDQRLGWDAPAKPPTSRASPHLTDRPRRVAARRRRSRSRRGRSSSGPRPRRSRLVDEPLARRRPRLHRRTTEERQDVGRLDLAISVATGTPFLATSTSRSRPVVYSPSKATAPRSAAASAASRAATASTPHGNADSENLHIVYKPPASTSPTPPGSAPSATRRTRRRQAARSSTSSAPPPSSKRTRTTSSATSSALAPISRRLRDRAPPPLRQAHRDHERPHTRRTHGRRRRHVRRVRRRRLHHRQTKAPASSASSSRPATSRNPEPLGVHLDGEPSGPLGGFVFTDTAEGGHVHPGNGVHPESSNSTGNQLDLDQTGQGWTNNGVHPEEMSDLQGKARVDRPDSPTESSPPSADAAETAPDDIDWTTP
jgi:hypothetical protein